MWAVLRCSPVNVFSFGEGKSEPQVRTLPLDDAEEVLETVNIRQNRVQADCQGEIIDEQDRENLRNCWMEAGNVKHKQKGRNRGALGGTNRHWAAYPRGNLEDKPAVAFGEE